MTLAPALLLTPKLHAPPTPVKHIARPQLIARLNDSRPLTLICAPAGYGKTTLAATQLGAAWFSIDPDDNDPARFFTYFIAALQTVAPNLGEAALGLLRAPQPPLTNIVTLLVNECAQLPAPIVLVLDDYHLITADATHDALVYLLDHPPANLRLILTTRADPPWPLARWRVRGQLTELRAADLRFTPAEAADFVKRVMGLNLSADDVATLEQRTEGWVAGLQLAALSLEGNASPSAFIAALSGSHHHIADYLLNELYQRQSPDVQTFLLHTSILERFSAPLCEALLEDWSIREFSNPLILLEHLERTNLFVTPLDPARRWWRYHALFAEALRARLRRDAPHLWATLHARASTWFEHNGHPDEAVHHALQAADEQNSARLIAAFAPSLMKRDDFATLRRWLAQLPQAVIWAHPRLCLAQIWTLLDFNQPESAQAYFDRVQELLAHAHEPALLVETLTLRAIAEAMVSRPAQALALAEQAQKLQAAADPFTRALLAYALGAAYKMGNDGLRAEHCLREAGLAALAAESAYLAVEAFANLGDLLVDLGRLPEAEQSLLRTLEQAHALTPTERPASGWLYWDLARIHFEWNDLDTARSEAEKSATLCAAWGNEAMHVRALLLQAQIHQAQQQWLPAQAALDEAEQIAQRAPSHTLRHMVMRRRVLVALAQNDLPRAQLLAETLQAQTPEPLPYFQAFIMARLCLAQGQPARALEFLKLTGAGLEKTNLVIGRIQALIIEALARRAMGQREQALHPLERALVLAQPGGFARSFLEHGAPMHELLRRAAANSAVPVYAQTLLAAFQSPILNSQLPITKRELEILHLLSAGFSNKQMSEQLVISEATLKRHLSNLYLKLDVHSRTQALAKAGELKLL